MIAANIRKTLKKNYQEKNSEKNTVVSDLRKFVTRARARRTLVEWAF